MTDRDLLSALLDKYRELKRLREADAAGRAGDPRAAMAALAARFPGALRELDRLPMHEIDARIAALERALAGSAPAPDWARWQAAFHGWLRAALRIRQLARGATSLDAALARVREGYVPAVDEPALSVLDAAVLEALVRPPEGRLTGWVIGWVAAEYGLPEADVRAALLDG